MWGPVPYGMPPGAQTFEAVREIRKGTRVYQVFVLVNLLVAVTLLGVLAAAGGLGGPGLIQPPTVPVGNNTTTTAPFSQGPTFSALVSVEAISGVFGFVGLFLIIWSWVTWRGGIQRLPRVIGEFGPAAYARAESALKDYARTIYTFIAAILVAVGLVVALAVILFSAISGTLSSSVTGAPGISVQTFQLEVYATLAVGIVLSFVLSFLMFFFASRSLVGSIDAIADPGVRGTLASGRRWILVGAALPAFALLGFVYLPLMLISLAAGLVLFVGFTLIVRAYGTFLARPPQPAPPPAPVPWR